MTITNRPEVSKTTALVYEALIVFIAALSVFFFCAAFFTPMGVIGGLIASTVSAFVGIIILVILLSLYRTRYVLTEKELIIKTTKLIGGNKTVPLETVRSVEKILIPFGVKLFGASFHGGYYHIPGLGKAFLAITNFQDGLLIKTKQRNYIITPSKPLDFKETIQSRLTNR